ncbi:MAG: 2-oxoglutarate dehydrogenase complex dihydrolipoyllysine-residue succinyltransferase [Candidatus Hydrogenedentes bacterium]|nr:2-oxoglutarate dehydrogenase complex dihydrolipoyllysine-residue succinyltransferase [Candidatus Hydrogenedentota bacterium]
MPVELKVPTVGESITEVQLGAWRKAPGDFVERDEAVAEVESDKATMEVLAPVSGTLTQILKTEGQTAKVGEVVALMEESKAPGDKPASSKAAASKKVEAVAPVAAAARVMPAAQRAMATHGVSAAQVQATGPGGRVLKEDVMRAAGASQAKVEAPKPAPLVPAPAPIAPKPDKAAAAATQEAASSYAPNRSEEAVPMTPMRKRIAERLVEAQQSAALLTTFNEIDMSEVMALRDKFKDAFVEKHGVKLGFMSFFVKASIEALKGCPRINAEIRHGNIVYHHYYDIGVAIGSGKGLAVPIIRNAERLGFAEIEKVIADFGARAKENKLRLDELEGGTFTISNGGVYGSMLSTPIVNPPQSGILGLHAIQDRPVARNGQVVIRPMMYVALTYDHRIVDGREAVTFLKRIKECVENPERMMLDV